MTGIVKAVGEQAICRIECKVIASVQRVNSGIAGDDNELKTIWDEICAQVQWEDESERETQPVLESNIVQHIVTHHVYARAGKWSNKRLRAYLDRASMTD